MLTCVAVKGRHFSIFATSSFPVNVSLTRSSRLLCLYLFKGVTGMYLCPLRLLLVIVECLNAHVSLAVVSVACLCVFFIVHVCCLILKSDLEGNVSLPTN